MSPIHFLFLLVVLFLAAAPAFSEESSILATAPEVVRTPMIAKDWKSAERELDQLLETKPKHADHWLLLKATAQRGRGALDAAEQSLLLLERDHTDSPWIHKSKFMRADLYRATNRYEEATRIYEEAAQRLRSAERQAELAEIYVRFGDELSRELDPNKPDGGQRDFERAFVLYGKVLDLGAPLSMREQASFRMAVCKEELRQWSAARDQYSRYLEDYGAAKTPEEAVERDEATEGRIVKARFARAHCRHENHELQIARKEFEDLAQDLKDMRDVGAVAPERKSELRELQGDALHRAAKTYRSHEATLAVAALERLLEAVPDWPHSTRARFDIGHRYQEAGRQEDALTAYKGLLATPRAESADSEIREEDQRLRMKALFQCGEILRGQKRYERAIATYNDYVARHSNGPDWAASQQAILSCEYDTGVYLRAEKRFEEARRAWTTFLERHPLDARAQSILLDLGTLYSEQRSALDDDAAEARDELARNAIAAWRRVPAKYPNTNEASHALFLIGQMHEEQGELREAINAYRECTFGSHQSEAYYRLETMTEESLAVLTKRTWRSNEEATIELTTRNIEKFELEIYSLDLEAYFRKHLTHQRIEDLDLDLIAPDQRIEMDVLDYEHFGLIQNQVEIPVEGPGVWAVAVIAGERRATTLVLRSDIDILVKSSRDEVFVYAQDMKAGKPAADVRILVGSKSSEEGILEAVTNQDGVAEFEFEERQDVNTLHVFALRNGHFASNGVSIENLEVPQGLTPRGWLYTDRSVYRPGQELNWRAVVREVSDGNYTFVEGKEYRLDVTDSMGRTVHRSRVPLSSFGTLSGSVALDEYAPVGTYTLQCRQGNSLVISESFTVEEYQLQKVELEFEFDREVYYRGEVVEASLQASYYYGEPVVDSPITYNLPDGRSGQTRTDENGRATFEFETRDFPRETALTFTATLTEEGLQRSSQVHLAVKGFRATLETKRNVYLAGDAFPVHVTTLAPDGEPVGRNLNLRVLRLESGAHGTSEVEISSTAVATDPKSGKAELPVRLAKGGTYLLRVEGLDRFKNSVFGQAQVFISGDEDEVSLRFLSDPKRWNVGEDASLELFNRADSGLALITFEGESILSYRLVELQEGLQSHRLPGRSRALPELRCHRVHDAEERVLQRRDPVRRRAQARRHRRGGARDLRTGRGCSRPDLGQRPTRPSRGRGDLARRRRCGAARPLSRSLPAPGLHLRSRHAPQRGPAHRFELHLLLSRRHAHHFAGRSRRAATHRGAQQVGRRARGDRRDARRPGGGRGGVRRVLSVARGVHCGQSVRRRCLQRPDRGRWWWRRGLRRSLRRQAQAASARRRGPEQKPGARGLGHGRGHGVLDSLGRHRCRWQGDHRLQGSRPKHTLAPQGTWRRPRYAARRSRVERPLGVAVLRRASHPHRHDRG